MRAKQAKELKALEPDALGKRLKKAKPKKKKRRAGGHAHRGPLKTLRTDYYKGCEIEIETTYNIKVNGKSIHGHLNITNTGELHYHPLPNYSWMSAVDLARQLIDSFPDEFGDGDRKAKPNSKAKKKKPKAKGKKTTKKRAVEKKASRGSKK